MPPPSYRQITLRHRFFGLETDDTTSFRTGMVRDVPQHLIPTDAVWDAKDVFMDVDGALIKRGGSKTVLSAGSNATMTQNGLGIMQAGSADALCTGYAISTQGAAYSFIPGSGTTTLTLLRGGAGATCTIGQPFQHQNLLVVPLINTAAGSGFSMYVLGGAQTLTSSTLTSSTLTISAGDVIVTGLNAADVAKCEPGQMLSVQNVANTTKGVYRIVAVGATTLTVEPTPSQNIVTAAGAPVVAPHYSFSAGLSAQTSVFYAGCGCSFQNRIVFGDPTMLISTPANFNREGNKICWGLLPTEQGFSLAVGSTTYDGYLVSLLGNVFAGSTYFNYIVVSGVDKIRALVPMNQDNLFILGSRGSALLTGQLVSEVASTRSLSYAVRSIQQGLGCMSQASVKQTSAGVMWASSDGVCVFDGTRVTNVMMGKIANYWQGLVAAGLTINGSAALTPNHYYLSTSAGGFLCNLDGFRWTRIANLPIFGAAIDPSSDNRTYANLGSSSGSVLTYKIFRIDPILNPDATVTSDADGNIITPSVQTRSFVGGDATVLKKLKHVRTNLVTNGATTTVSITGGIDGSGSTQTLGTVTTATTPQESRFELTTQVIDTGWSYTLSTAASLTSWVLYGMKTEFRHLWGRRTS